MRHDQRLGYLQLVPRRLTRMEFPFDRSESVQRRFFKETRRGGGRKRVESASIASNASCHCRERNTTSPIVASKRLLAMVRSTTATLIGFINTIKNYDHEIVEEAREGIVKMDDSRVFHSLSIET